MLLSAVSFLVVAQSSSEIPEGLMNNPALTSSFSVTGMKAPCFSSSLIKPFLDCNYHYR